MCGVEINGPPGYDTEHTRAATNDAYLQSAPLGEAAITHVRVCIVCESSKADPNATDPPIARRVPMRPRSASLDRSAQAADFSGDALVKMADLRAPELEVFAKLAVQTGRRAKKIREVLKRG